MRDHLEVESAASASRLSRGMEDSQCSELAEYLRSASEEVEGDLVAKLESWTRVRWSDEDSHWPALQTILKAIADSLDKHRTSHS